MFREPEAIEGMIDDLWSAATNIAYQRVGRALTAAKDAGASPADDPEATATVLVAALAYLPIAELLIGRTPGDIDTERFREAWLRLAEGVFTGMPPT